MTPRLRRIAVTAVTLVLALASVGGAQAHGPDPTLGGGAVEQDLELRFRWRSGSEPPSSLRTAILAAALDVTESKRSNAATFVYDAAGPNPIGYGAGATCGVNGIACFTRTLPDDFTMWFRAQGHVFDWGVLKWCDTYSTPPNGCYDVENVALDEFGHIEGLAHHINYADDRDYTDAVVQTYSRTKPSSGYNAHRFGVCDVATLQRIYDIEVTWQRYSTCLDLATTVVLAAQPTSLLRGESAKLTATLRVADDSAYGRLRNNLVSKRVVSLERRTSGTTTWYPVGTMTTGNSGTYTLSTTVSVSTEFRAVYRATTDEGLRGDVSPYVKVTVTGCSRPPCPL